MSLSLALAWLVHLYTALGAVIAFLSVILIYASQFREAFGLMALAVIIDATDGTLARAARVKEVIPWFDGDRLDDIIDYCNYVIVPCILIFQANLLPSQDALWLASLPVLASAYGFCQKEAKTADYYYLGFPSYWNIVALYLFVLPTPRWGNAFLIIILAFLVFVPIKYIYPSRSPRYRTSMNVIGVLWGIALLMIIYTLPQPPQTLVFASLLYPAYYAALSLWLDFTRPSS